MDNREENSRNTEQDRVDNPVENTVSTMVETALSENKRERKKREKAENADALNIVCVAVLGVFVIVASAVGGDEFVGIVVDHGSSLQIHLAAVYDR